MYLSMQKKLQCKSREMCTINVTPLVDVMLVLLIVFMVTSPMIMSNVNINLPKSSNTNNEMSQTEKNPLIIIVDNKGNLYIQDNQVNFENLLSQIELFSYGNKDIDIHIHGDEYINYGKIMHTISAINNAGYSRVSLVAIVESENV